MNDPTEFWKLSHLRDNDLESRIDCYLRNERLSTARLVAHLAEVLDRRLHLKQAFPTMTAYCRDKLGMREDDAGRRIVAARVARRFPSIYPLLDAGELSLSVICKLKHYVTDTNHEQLIEGVRGKSFRQAEAWLAARFPRADVRSTVRKLPASIPAVPTSGPGNASAVAAQCSAAPRVGPTGSNGQPRLLSTESGESPPNEPAAAPLSPPPRRVDSGAVDPLAAARYRVQFTAGLELKEKLELARDLMSHSNPSGDFAPIVERALDLLIAELKKKRFGVTDTPRRGRGAKPERVTNQTRREVAERDGIGCAYVDETGKRCGARAFLQYDHREARGRGGGSGTDNVRQLCAEHNRLEAERVYGRVFVERAIAKRRAQQASSELAEPTDLGSAQRSEGCSEGRLKLMAGAEPPADQAQADSPPRGPESESVSTRVRRLRE